MDEDNRVVLTLEDNTELECNIIAVFQFGDNEYIALNPIEDEEVLIYRFIEEKQSIEFIESDNEYEEVTNAFYEMIEE